MAAAHFFNLLVPSVQTVLSDPRLTPLGYTFFGLLPESDVIAGIPLILILYLWAKENRHSRLVYFVLSILFVILVASLGPQLWYGARFTDVSLPWRLIIGLPFLGSALPVRFAVYSSLLIALLVAHWVSGKVSPRQAGRLEHFPIKLTDILLWRRNFCIRLG